MARGQNPDNAAGRNAATPCAQKHPTRDLPMWRYGTIGWQTPGVGRHCRVMLGQKDPSLPATPPCSLLAPVVAPTGQSTEAPKSELKAAQDNFVEQAHVLSLRRGHMALCCSAPCNVGGQTKRPLQTRGATVSLQIERWPARNHTDWHWKNHMQTSRTTAPPDCFLTSGGSFLAYAATPEKANYPAKKNPTTQPATSNQQGCVSNNGMHSE